MKNVSPTGLQGEYNVRAYGAKGDSTGDDAPFINAALNAAFTAGGGTVLVPPGIYNIGSVIRPRANTTLKAGAGVTYRRTANDVMMATGLSGEDVGTLYNGHANITIDGGLWDMRGATLTTYMVCMATGHNNGFAMRNVTIKDTPGLHAIEVNSSKNVRIENCRFIGFYHTGDRGFSEAIQLDLAKNSSVGTFATYDHTSCDDVVISNCYFGASGTGSTQAWPRGVGSHSGTIGSWHTNITVTQCHFDTLTEAAVFGYNWYRVVLSDNTIVGCSGGLFVTTVNTADTEDTKDTSGAQTSDAQDIHGVVIADNVIQALTGAGTGVGAGIWVEAYGTKYVYSVNITGNSIDSSTLDADSQGILLKRVRRVTVADNTLLNQGDIAVAVYNGEDVKVADNVIYSCESTGVYVDTCADVTISDNHIRDADRNGIHVVGGSNAVITDNVIRDAGLETNATYYGIRVTSSTAGGLVSGNRVRKAGSGNVIINGISITSTCSGIALGQNDVADTTVDWQGTAPAAPRGAPTLVVRRVTTQSVTSATDTAVAWSSALKNTGPTTWWASGAANNIVLPWAGLYHVTAYLTWASNASGVRAMHLNRTTTIATSNFIAADATAETTTQEGGRTLNFSTVIDEPTAGTTYVLAAYQSSGGALNIDDVQPGQQAKAWMSFTYLGNA
ncbi:right-handed parallel beta-helix repeat-containing protein [Streptomyces sp. NPDC058471]|uniref:right-handed parallel beta-helix repeat-containing protein n=1 Tax=Streptomyces sp. NPDC058471 TaxID=3346516 RepID=UPI003652EC21